MDSDDQFPPVEDRDDATLREHGMLQKPGYPFVLVAVHPETLRRGPATVGVNGPIKDSERVSVLDQHWATMRIKAQEAALRAGTPSHEYACVMMAVPARVADAAVEAMRGALQVVKEESDAAG